MPDIQDRKDNRFSRFDAMSTEDLQAFLREDASKPVGEESDTKEILYVMEVLARRRKEQQEGKNPAEALASFKHNYYTENEIPSISERAPVVRKRSNGGRWRRGLVAAVAAICILIIGNSITANALGFDLFAIIAKWTQETFHFGSPSIGSDQNDPVTSDETPYKELSAILSQNGIHAQLVPSWIPEGYVEASVKIQETPTQRVFIAIYEHGEESIRIRIADYLNTYPVQVEQSDELLEVVTHDEIDYYIFDNEGQLQVAWVNDHFECYISAPLSLSEIKMIIDSIEKG